MVNKQNYFREQNSVLVLCRLGTSWSHLERTLAEEMSPLYWPVDKPLVHFLN